MPLYLQVRSIVADAIRRELLPRGSQLPSTPQLARQLRVSVLTAHHGLQCLVEDGLLERSRGRCTYVRPDYRIVPTGARPFKGNVALQRQPVLARRLVRIADEHPADDGTAPEYEPASSVQEAHSESNRWDLDGLLWIDPTQEDLRQIARLAQAKNTMILVASADAAASVFGQASAAAKRDRA